VSSFTCWAPLRETLLQVARCQTFGFHANAQSTQGFSRRSDGFRLARVPFLKFAEEMAPYAWPQRGQMFIANVAATAFFSFLGARCVASRTNISLRWSEEVPMDYRFSKHLAALQPGRADTNYLADFRDGLARVR